MRGIAGVKFLDQLLVGKKLFWGEEGRKSAKSREQWGNRDRGHPLAKARLRYLGKLLFVRLTGFGDAGIRARANNHLECCLSSSLNMPVA